MWRILFSLFVSNQWLQCHLQDLTIAACADPNATPQECASACQPTCAVPQQEYCAKQCISNGCVCNSGYILDKDNGTCIKTSDCPTNVNCNGDPNAHFTDCGSYCAPNCEDSEPRFCPAVCASEPMCVCNENYTYSRRLKKCILTSSPDCVPCPLNQQWSDCIPAACTPLTCEDVGFPIACPDYLYGQCEEKGCICKYGYVRNSKNECIPKEQCPSCGGDKNATSGCIKNCKNGKQNLCSNYKNNISCDENLCGFNDCECNDGFVYDDINNKCVKQRDCPKPCKGDPYATEVCGCGTACPPTCAIPNPEICTEQCEFNSCRCVSGYIFDKINGKCVKVERCPDDQGCNGDENAIITSCADPCPPTCQPTGKDCSTMGCIQYGCTCKYGYILDKEGGTCIKQSDCNNTNTDDAKVLKEKLVEF